MKKVFYIATIAFNIVSIHGMNVPLKSLEDEFATLKSIIKENTLPSEDPNLLDAYKLTANIYRNMKAELDQEALERLRKQIRTCKNHLELINNYYQDRKLKNLLEIAPSSYSNFIQTHYDQTKIQEEVAIVLGRILVMCPSEDTMLAKAEALYDKMLQEKQFSERKLGKIKRDIEELSQATDINLFHTLISNQISNQTQKNSTPHHKSFSYKKVTTYLGCAGLCFAAGWYSWHKLPAAWYRTLAITTSFTGGIGFSYVGITKIIQAYL